MQNWNQIPHPADQVIRGRTTLHTKKHMQILHDKNGIPITTFDERECLHRILCAVDAIHFRQVRKSSRLRPAVNFSWVNNQPLIPSCAQNKFFCPFFLPRWDINIGKASFEQIRQIPLSLRIKHHPI